MAKAQISRLDSDVANLKRELEQAQSDIFDQKLRANPYGSATFDPAGDEGFSRVDTSVGTFTISLQDVKPFADGVRVRLHVGNLTAATVSNAVLKVKWGQRGPESKEENFLTKYYDWKKSIREKEITINEDLKSGRWNNVTITLPGTPPTEFGYLELSMETPRISLLVPARITPRSTRRGPLVARAYASAESQAPRHAPPCGTRDRPRG